MEGILVLTLLGLFFWKTWKDASERVNERQAYYQARRNSRAFGKPFLNQNWNKHNQLYPGGSPYSSDWISLSNRVKARDGQKCTCCGVSRSNVPLHAHHIVPLSKGGANHPANLVSLCRPCHNIQHNRRF